jgi:glycosyltransferase involved in cell wall biosynthesis
MRILITNLFLARGTGTEAVVELLADGLRRAGHEPILFAPKLGPLARRMRARGHRIIDRIGAMPFRPDVIHAQHATPALMAMAAFPEVPVVFACHSSIFEVEAPLPHPQIRRVTALDERGRDRCVGRGIDPNRIAVVQNAVDIERFRRRPPLPTTPERGLLVAKAGKNLGMIRTVCERMGLPLTEIGFGVGRPTSALEEEFQTHDIVFASGRSALEAACAGCSVVVVEGNACAGLLTTATLDGWRDGNFGVAILNQPTDASRLEASIAAYDPAEAARVTDRLRQDASVDGYVARYVALYAEAIADEAVEDRDLLASATARWLEELLPTSTDRPWRQVAHEVGQMAPEALPIQELRGIETRLMQRMERLTEEFRALDARLAGIAERLGDGNDGAASPRRPD